MSGRSKKKKKSSSCKHLFIDVFGHPFCLLKQEEALKCEYCLISQEYKEVMAQQDSKEYKAVCKGNSGYKFPSIYRCTRLDHLSDSYGHLPERMRPKLKKGLHSITVEF